MLEVVTPNDLIEAAHDGQYASLPRGETYRDLSTIIITPTRGNRVEKQPCPHCGKDVDALTVLGFDPRVVDSWERLFKPMNQPCVKLSPSGYEVGDAYESAIELILSNPDLAKFKYVLFLEDDIIVPFMPGTRGPLHQLYQRIDEGYSVAAGLYYTKNTPGEPLIFGDPEKGAENYEPITSGWEPGDVVECNGAGMGFTLTTLDLFRDPAIERPWFRTMEEVGKGNMTQDLYFCKKLRQLGYRICVDSGVRCGHLNLYDGRVY